MSAWIQKYNCTFASQVCANSVLFLFKYNGKKLHILYINKIQQDPTVCRYLFTAKSFYMLLLHLVVSY
jgi:hypothetical protein